MGAFAAGDRAADQAGVAALGHDRHLVVRAGAHHGGDLLGVGRADDRPGATGEPAGPVGLVRRAQVGVDQHMRGPHGIGQRALEAHRSILPVIMQFLRTQRASATLRQVSQALWTISG